MSTLAKRRTNRRRTVRCTDDETWERTRDLSDQAEEADSLQQVEDILQQRSDAISEVYNRLNKLIVRLNKLLVYNSEATN